MKFTKGFTEPKAIALLVLIFIILSAWVIRFPHDKGDTKGTIPDEYAFYAWGEIYLEGKIAVPVSDFGANYNSEVSITNSSETIIFINASIGSYDQNAGQDIAVYVYNSTGAVPNATVTLEGLSTTALTGPDGIAYFYNTHTYGQMSILATYTNSDNVTGITHYVLQGQGQSAIYSIYANVDANILETLPNGMVKVDLVVTVIDIFGNPVEGALVRAGNIEVGTTDAKGVTGSELIIGQGLTSISVVKASTRSQMNVMGVVTQGDDGVYYYANRWPPGFSYLLGAFIKLGIESAIGVFVVGTSTVGLYLFTRRIKDHKAAFFASLLALFSGGGMLMFYSRYQADYASAGYAMLGFYLLLEGYLQARKKRWVPVVALGLSGGLLMGWSVTMRYSAVVLIFAPAFYLLLSVLIAKKEENARPDASDEPEWMDDDYRRPPSRRGKLGKGGRDRVEEYRDTGKNEGFIHRRKGPFFSAIKVGVPFLVGLIIMGSLLMWYNASLFGGPFNSGYQRGHSIAVTSDPKNGTSASDMPAPTESFFEQYFNYRHDDYMNIPRIFSFLFFLIPALFMTPLGLFALRKEPASWACLIWIIAIMVIYLSQGWAAWHDGGSQLSNSLEDMRYYLPVMPAACILAGAALGGLYWNNLPMKVAAFGIVGLLVFSGILVAGVGIQTQLDRLKNDLNKQPNQNQQQNNNLPNNNNDQQNTGEFQDVTLAQIMANPGSFRNKNVRVSNVIVASITPQTFNVTDGTYEIAIRVLDGPKPPKGSDVTVQGRVLPNLDDMSKWEIKVEAGGVTVNSMTRAGPTTTINIKFDKPKPGEMLPPVKQFTVHVIVTDTQYSIASVEMSIGGVEWKPCAKQSDSDVYTADFDLSKYNGSIMVLIRATNSNGDGRTAKLNLYVNQGLPTGQNQQPGNQQQPGPNQPGKVAWDGKGFHPLANVAEFLPAKVCIILALIVFYIAPVGSFVYERTRKKEPE